MKIKIETQDKEKAISLVYFLRTKGYSVEIEDEGPLKDEDWVFPGRPATEEEHEAHARAMEEEEKYGRYSTFEESLQNIKEYMKEWKKQNE
ncbi:MAG: hypothetical protein K9I94_10255 [Bacteroidales bacterium]|nr:hypothetical protein [Bacteroidales bacterium]